MKDEKRINSVRDLKVYKRKHLDYKTDIETEKLGFRMYLLRCSLKIRLMKSRNFRKLVAVWRWLAMASMTLRHSPRPTLVLRWVLAPMWQWKLVGSS